jgi:hypothetical protein
LSDTEFLRSAEISGHTVTPEEEGIPDLQARSVEERFRRRVTMHVPDRNNPKLHRLMEWVNANDELYALWVAANVTAIERLGMTDHGPVHVKIVTNIALRLLRLLMDGEIQPSVSVHYGMDRDDAEVVVALAALLHDVGMSIHRTDHEEYSLFLAHDLMKELPEELLRATGGRDRALGDLARHHRTSLRRQAADARRRGSCAWPMPWTWRRVAPASPSSPDR